MNALPQQAPVLPSSLPASGRISLDELAACVQALDPGSRALLDLSLRRRLPFEAMAGVLHTDPFDLARRRARAVARIAAELDLEGSGVVATVKAALARLPDDAWGVAVTRAAKPPIAPPEPDEPIKLRAVQAESMAEAARALMDKLKTQRDAIIAQEAAAAADQPTVEMEAVVIEPEAPAPVPEAWPPMAATPMAAAFSHHPAFAIERDDEVASLPPLAEALARAAESERTAAAERAQVDAPAEPATEVPVEDIPAEPLQAGAASVRPAPPLAPPHGADRESGRRLARGGLLVGLLLALVRLLFGRR